MATPEEATTAGVPSSAAPLVPVPGVIATVTLPLNPSARLPRASSAVTRTAGLNSTPADMLDGATLKASVVAGPAIVKVPLVAPRNPSAVAASR